MNGIFGLYNLSGGLVEDAAFAAMQAGMAFWPPASAGQWRQGEIVLGCLHRQATPEAAGERLPIQHAASGVVLTAGARLDNRAGLLEILKAGEGSLHGTITDAEIILHAYLRWGEECVTYLDGDWHFALWDERARRLFVARDHQGNTGLYYHHNPQFFAFASIKKGLLALETISKRPDLLRIAQVLTSWPGDGVRTGYEDIHRLPPAHQMAVEPEGIKIKRYWSPETGSPLMFNSDDAYVEAFLEAFTRAVLARLRTHHPVAVTLSGGLDSGSVAATAARELTDRGQKLIAYTAVPGSDPRPFIDPRRFGDETRMAQATAEHAGIEEHLLLQTESLTPLAGIERMLAVHDEPGHAAANQYWLTDLLDHARQRGIGVLLSGQMGNATISWTGGGENLLPLLLQGNIARLWQALEKAGKAAGLSRWRAARRFLLKPVLMPLWLHYQQHWRPGPPEWRAYSAIHPDYARKIDLKRLMAAEGHRPPLGSTDPLQHRLLVIQPGRNILGSAWLEKGAAFGLEVRDPTQDRQLIELCLAIPESQYQRDGMDRWLIRRAMAGYLPDSVRLNRRRGLQAADLAWRVLADKERVRRALSRLDEHHLAREMLDLPRMERVLGSLERGPTRKNTLDCGTILLRGLMAGLFLLRF